MTLDQVATLMGVTTRHTRRILVAERVAAGDRYRFHPTSSILLTLAERLALRGILMYPERDMDHDAGPKYV